MTSRPQKLPDATTGAREPIAGRLGVIVLATRADGTTQARHLPTKEGMELYETIKASPGPYVRVALASVFQEEGLSHA